MLAYKHNLNYSNTEFQEIQRYQLRVVFRKDIWRIIRQYFKRTRSASALTVYNIHEIEWPVSGANRTEHLTTELLLTYYKTSFRGNSQDKILGIFKPDQWHTLALLKLSLAKDTKSTPNMCHLFLSPFDWKGKNGMVTDIA